GGPGGPHHLGERGDLLLRLQSAKGRTHAPAGGHGAPQHAGQAEAPPRDLPPDLHLRAGDAAVVAQVPPRRGLLARRARGLIARAPGALVRAWSGLPPGVRRALGRAALPVPPPLPLPTS